MPISSTNFCKNDFAWAVELVKNGNPLHYLCHDKWRGCCTSTEAHKESCAKFFNAAKFKLPISVHPPALEEFFCMSSKGSAECARQILLEYTEALKLAYPADDIAYLITACPRLRLFFKHNFGAPLDQPQQMHATSMLNLVEAGIIGRAALPASASALLDWSNGRHTHTFPELVRAERYIAWLSDRRMLLRQSDIPALTKVVSGLLDSRLPPDLHCLVLKHLFF